MKFQEVLGAVETFHDSFGIENHYAPTVALTPAEIQLRFDLMKEENEEYLEAAQKGDMVEVADALGDQLYILCGTILRHGLQDKIEEVFQEIQRSNMSKLDACPKDTDGDGGCESPFCETDHRKPIFREDGKVLKGPHYFKPDIKSILEHEGSDGL